MDRMFTDVQVFQYGHPIELSQYQRAKLQGLPRMFEASRAHGFVLRSLELHILSFIWECGELLKRRVATKQRVAYQRFAYQRFEQVASCSRSELLYTKQRVAYQRFAYMRFELTLNLGTNVYVVLSRIRDNGENILKSITEDISYGNGLRCYCGGTVGAVQQRYSRC
ncbi:hypothetical protein Tco_0185820 [Tanacetum coccineum]